MVRRGLLVVGMISDSHSCSLDLFGSSAAEPSCTNRDEVWRGANAASATDFGVGNLMFVRGSAEKIGRHEELSYERVRMVNKLGSAVVVEVT